MDACGHPLMESTVARAYVSNPYAGEIVKGHAIVLAQMGLAPFAGTIVRDPATFEGEWSRSRRREHVVHRLGYLRALLPAIGLEHLELWRGVATHARLETERERTFTSTSFSREVARSLVEAGADGSDTRLVRHSVGPERVFMSYLETRAMNAQFLEAEAVLLSSPGDGWI